MWEFVDFLEVASLENAIPHEREYIVAQLLRSSVGPPMGNVTERVESLSGTSRDEIINGRPLKTAFRSIFIIQNVHPLKGSSCILTIV